MTDAAVLEERAAAWDRLALDVPQRLPMLAHGWIAPLFEQRTQAAWSWVVVFAWSGDRLVGVLPAFVVPSRTLGLSRPRLHVPCSYNTFAGDPLLAPDRAESALPALLRALGAHAGRPLRLDLGCMRECSPTYACIARGLPGWATTRGAANLGASVRIAGTYDAWLQGLSKSLRRDIRRSENRMKRDGHEPVYVSYTGAEARPELLDDLMAIEATTWKGDEGGAIAACPAREARYRAVAARFHARGWLEWHHLRIGGRLAAAHMLVRIGRSQMLLRQAYDAGLAPFRGGHLLLREAVRRAFDADGAIAEINLVNDHPWCRRWNMHVERYHNVVAAPKRPLPLLFGVGPGLGRSAARRIPGLKGLVARVRRP